MPKFISDDDMAALEASQPKKNFISDDDMAAMEAYHSRPGFIDKIKSIPSSIAQAGRTLLNAPQDISRAAQNPGEAADVAARGLASGASFLDIPESTKLMGEKVFASLPTSLGGLSGEEYQNQYGDRDDQDLINQNMIHESKERAKYPAIDLVSRATGFAAGNNPASMILKTGTQSASRALNDGASGWGAVGEGLEDALIQSGLTYGPQAIVKIPSAINSISGKLKGTAESLAENATGATGVQASKFREGAGRELLDRGIVKFFDSPENVAERANSVAEAAGKQINSVLSDLDQKGVTASIPNVINALQEKAAELDKVPGNDSIIAKIQTEIDHLNDRIGLDQGPPELSKSEIPISQGEQAKRNFQDSVNYASPVADQKGAFHSAGAFRSEVERAAETADPNAANTFKSAKDTYGLIAPIAQAAEKRASQLGQNPLGGLHDVASFIGGGAPGVVAKRVLFPRLSSSLAVSSDWLSKKLAIDPQGLGKYSKPLSDAAARGGNALGVTHYILQSVDPEYQKLMQQDSDMGKGDER